MFIDVCDLIMACNNSRSYVYFQMKTPGTAKKEIHFSSELTNTKLPSTIFLSKCVLRRLYF